MSRRDADEAERLLNLSLRERKKNVSLQWDEDLGIWIKEDSFYWSEKRNAWMPFSTSK